MKVLKVTFCNFLWLLVCLKEWLAFIMSCNFVEKAQKNKLLDIIKKNQNTQFGKKYNFRSISNVSDFTRKVPLADYECFKEYVTNIASGGEGVLTEDPVIILEPTSGSTDGTKLIPYNNTLQKEFMCGIKPWIFNLLYHGKIISGTAYWSITPLIKNNFSFKSVIPIGFKDDSEYFGKTERGLVRSILAVPKEVCEISDMDNFRYATLIFLVGDGNLSFISVWNPTFLTILLEYLVKWKNSIITDIENGTISFPNKVNALLAKNLENKIGPNKRRALQVKTAITEIEKNGKFSSLWPKLSVISCWADGSSASYAKEIENIFPGVTVQPKGLLATEGIISFPFLGKNGSLLSIRSHFFEFIEHDLESADSKSVKLAHQLEKGKRYSVVLTLGNGFYRYEMGDVVEVVGFYLSCPLIRFISRSKNISDLFGEKVNEIFLENVLRLKFEEHSIETKFAMVSPNKDEIGKTAYVLFLELKKAKAEEHLQQLCKDIEISMQNNFHYSYCRKLEQLSHFKIFLINNGGKEDYINSCVARGQRLGDIKISVLRKELDWTGIFNGNFIN